MENKDLSFLVGELRTITGVKHVLPFKDALVIDFDLRYLPCDFTEEKMINSIKLIVRNHGFNMLTEKKTKSKRVINLFPLID